MIAALDVKREFRERLEATGLWDSLDLTGSQFLDLSSQVFVELVLFDAGVANRVADIAGDIRLSHPDEEIDVVIRARWSVRSVHYAGAAVGLSGGVRMADRYDVVIVSGSVSQRIIVDVTKDAIEQLESRLKAPGVDPSTYRQIVADLVRGYVELHLSHGGTSYWDPVRFPSLDINAAAVQYMIGHQLFKVGV
ncbi:MAG TPA: hypothetical protein VII95_18790 [Terriglobales bacterium]